MQHLAIVIAAMTAIGAQAEAEDADHAVRLAENAFQFRDFATVVATLDPWLHPPRILDKTLLITARRLMGVALAGLEREEEAKEEFGQLLLLDPTHELDPFVVPPNIIAVFQGVREEMKDTLDRLTGKTAPEEVETSVREVVRVEIATLPPRWMMALPGGTPQFTLDQQGFGTLWLALQVIGIALSVIAYQTVESGLVDEELREFARSGPYYGLITLQYSGLAMFAGAWVASSLLGFSRYDDVEAELRAPRDPVPLPPAGGALTFSW